MPRFKSGYLGFFWGGLGSANFIFMGAGIVLTLLSADFCTDAILHVNRLTLTFARHFPAFKHLRFTHSHFYVFVSDADAP